jgi:mgtE-like transporter
MKIIKESIIIVIISTIIGMITGTVLSFNNRILYAFPIILLILPSLNSLIGNMSTVLTARLTSHLYIGIIPPKIEISKRLREDFIGLIVTLLMSLISLIIIGYAMGLITGVEIINPWLIIMILLLTTFILFGALFLFLFLGTIYLFKRGIDPNNFLIPFTTSLSDFLTPIFLIIFIQIFI